MSADRNCVQCLAPLTDVIRSTKRYCSEKCKKRFQRAGKAAATAQIKHAPLKAPFPYPGGKSKVADVVWQRFGDVPNYVEGFAGSCAVLLSRPHPPRVETVNDASGHIANFWRAVTRDPDAVAKAADYPVSEVDLHAVDAWLTGMSESLAERLEGDPRFYDTEIAGKWVWGMCVSIAEFCTGHGPWMQVGGKLIKTEGRGGVYRGRPNISIAGAGIKKSIPFLAGNGKGVNRQSKHGQIGDWMRQLSQRLARVRVCCGDWSRVCTPAVTTGLGLTGVFLDPPYGSLAGRDNGIYSQESATVAYDAQAWCIEHGSNKLLRIALCGYTGEHETLASHGWSVYHWQAQGGLSNLGHGKGRENSKKEVIWFSPHCLSDSQMALW